MPVIQPITSASSGSAYVPTSRTLTINGVTYDLTADRSWTVEVLDNLIATAPLSYNSGTNTISISQSSNTTDGYLSSTDWLTFSSKQNAITLTTTGNNGAATLVGATLNIPEYTLAGLGGMANVFTSLGDIVYSNAIGIPTRRAGNITTTKMFLSSTGDGTSANAPIWEEITPSTINAVPTSRTLTINGTAFDLSVNRSWSVGTVTSIGLTTMTTGITIGSSPITTSGNITINIDTASSTLSGLLSNSDWSYFDAKMGNPFTSLGDIVYSNAIGIPLRRAGNITTTKMFLSQTGDGTSSAAPQWSTVTAADTGAVPTSRQLTINGTVYDLSADRTWSVGTVTSVALSVPTGFAVAGSPITSSGTLALSFASGYSLPTTTKQGEWDTAYNRSATALAYNTSTGVITLTKQDTTTLTATVTLAPFTTTNLTEGTNLYYTDAKSRAAISLTTTGSSGSSTYNSTTGVLNVPTYTAAGLGAVPTTRTLTINDVAYDLSANRSWDIGDFGTW